jgi:hypothetical protein
MQFISLASFAGEEVLPTVRTCAAVQRWFEPDLLQHVHIACPAVSTPSSIDSACVCCGSAQA